MNDNIIQNLLSHVNAINKKYEEIAEITGENFNIFNILGLTTNEVRTHSAFIAELLNPKGSHGCKHIFLKLFIEEVIEEIRNFINKKKEEIIGDNDVFLNNINEFTSSENCSAIVEHAIGLINESNTEGGRIDILIRDQNNHEIIIENKIYAGEQQNQLIRYYNYNSQAPIIYLTLFEEKPTSIKSEKKELKENKDFFCITYKRNILNWLEKCRKEAVNHSLLRETIAQYINLIKYLTNQTINNKMNEEIVNLIAENSNYIDSAFLISSTLEDVKQKLLKDFKIQLNEITEDLKRDSIEISCVIDDNIFNAYTGFIFDPKSWSQFRIGFEFENKNGCDLSYGICRKDGEKQIDYGIIDNIKKELNDFDYGNDKWPKYKYFESEYQQWANNKNVWISIINKTLKENIKKKVKDLIERLKDIKM